MQRQPMAKRQLILLGAWCVCYIAALEFFRFRFGLFPISAAFIVIGFAVMFFFGRPENEVARRE